MVALGPCALSAQDRIEFFGKVKDHDTGASIEAVRMRVTNVFDTVTTAEVPISEGKYQFAVDYDRVWLMKVSAPGYIPKSILLDARGVPKADRPGGHGLQVDWSLLAELEGIEYSVILDQPFGKALWNSKRGFFEWDMEYTNAMKTQQLRLIRAHERRRHELGMESTDADISVSGGVLFISPDGIAGPGVIHVVDTILNEHLFATVIDSSGRFNLKLPYGSIFRLQFVVPGAVQRHILLDAVMIPKALRTEPQAIEIDVRTLRPVKDGDYQALRAEPGAVFRYDESAKRFKPDPVQSPKARAIEDEAVRKQKRLMVLERK